MKKNCDAKGSEGDDGGDGGGASRFGIDLRRLRFARSSREEISPTLKGQFNSEFPKSSRKRESTGESCHVVVPLFLPSFSHQLPSLTFTWAAYKYSSLCLSYVLRNMLRLLILALQEPIPFRFSNVIIPSAFSGNIFNCYPFLLTFTFREYLRDASNNNSPGLATIVCVLAIIMTPKRRALSLELRLF